MTNESDSLFGSRRMAAQAPTASAPVPDLARNGDLTPNGQSSVSDSADQGSTTETASVRTMSGSSPGTRPRRAHRHDVDVMRVLAGLTVMVGHSGGVLIGCSEEGSDAWWLGHLAEAVNPWAVPMFFMIAGWAVLAGAPPRTEAKMWDRIIRHLVPLAAWSVIFVLGFNLFDTDEVNVRHDLARSFLEAGRPAFHLWYLYAYIPFILVFGTLVLFWKNQRPWKLAALALLLAGSTVWAPFLLGLIGSEQDAWKWGFATYQVAYFVIGAFIIHHAEELRPPIWSLCLLFAASALGVLWWESQKSYPIENANPLIVGLAVSVILLVSRLRLGERTKKVFTRLASASFGAFLCHVFFLELFFERLYDVDTGPILLVAQYLGFLIAMAAASYALSLTWGKLHLRRILG
ncbi:acyltransferase [Brevibacterium spongiae]|uniref:Acyltransferase n=1 Tax=Brevibacterium spongiae TaxID=2909672 RepID=A0ABY5SUN1_9MICO|nr:acyltransferase [Brevibacterium spongiae]UVI37601.1 acyltransferase [Brevibacterium spongiae]